MAISYPHPPTRADYERAVASLELLGGPTPPKTVNVGPRPGDGKPAPDVEANPLHGAYVQAQASAIVDRQIVRAYEGFVDAHADRYADLQRQAARGELGHEAENFVRLYERRRDEVTGTS
jgi:hypothetical protein